MICILKYLAPTLPAGGAWWNVPKYGLLEDILANVLFRCLLPLFLPSKLEIKLKLYEQVAEISDLRGSQPKLSVLYKNLYIVESIDASKNTLSVTIVNGPVDNGFNGEVVALFMTLSNFDDINTGSLKLTHLGTSVIGYYKDTEILFGNPIDLATKAAAVGELLSDGSCQGTVRFVSSNSFVTDCNI